MPVTGAGEIGYTLAVIVGTRGFLFALIVAVSLDSVHFVYQQGRPVHKFNMT